MNLVSAIVLAAGRGARFSRPNSFTVGGGLPNHINKMIDSGKSRISKPLAKINSQPIIIYPLKVLAGHPYVKDVLVVANPENAKDIISQIKRYRISKVDNIVRGGMRRQDSVRNALKALDNSTDLVLIHDGVRPFIDTAMVSAVIKEARHSGAAIVGVPVKATIKMVAYRKSQIANRTTVKKTLDRNTLWEIQTPQVFRKDLILRAYEKFGNMDVTDDAMLMEKLGTKVSVVFGSYNNIKITTPEDLVIAEAILKCKSRINP